MARFTRVEEVAGEPSVLVSLAVEERDLLGGLRGRLVELIEQDSGAVRDRLFPRAYLDPTESDAEAEWQRLMHADLLRGKLAAAEVFGEVLSSGEVGAGGVVTVRLDTEQQAAWLGALNDLRIALGVLLEVTEDLDPGRIPPDDPRAPSLALYGWLTWCQGALVDALDPRRPDDPF